MFARILFISLTILTSSAFGLVYQYEDYPATNLVDRPDANCVARITRPTSWYCKPTATVIAPNFILTAAHWISSGDMVGYYVSIGNNNSDDYIIVQSRLDRSKDLAVYRVEKRSGGNADFTKWVNLYDQSDEIGKETVLGSFGPQRRLFQGVSFPVSVEPEKETPPKGAILVVPSTLNWGRNIITSSSLGMTASAIGQGDYVKYEVSGGMYDSGGGWYIKDIEWKMASQFYTTASGPRISSYITWIEQQVYSMGGPQTLSMPELANVHWAGGIDLDWYNAGNWDTNSVPGVDDVVAVDSNSEPNAVISNEQTQVKKLFVGINSEGNLTQNGGILAISDYMYVGGRTGCIGKYTIGGGELDTQALVIGTRGTGTLKIADANSLILVTKKLSFGEKAIFEAEPNSTIQISMRKDLEEYDIDGRFDLDPNIEPNNVAGLANTAFVCSSSDSNDANTVIMNLEVAGADTNSVSPADFCTANFVIDKLIVGNDTSDQGSMLIRLINKKVNQLGSVAEALYVNTLELRAGVTFELDTLNTGNPPFNLYYKNGGQPKRFLMGDVNLDGVVDENDLAIWTAHEGEPNARWGTGDVNGDHLVNDADYEIIDRAMRVAKTPLPASGSPITQKIAVLTWEAGVLAASHNIYIGTTFNNVKDANESSTGIFRGNQAENSFTLNESLINRHTYYWRIDEVDSNGKVTKGYVWQFLYAPANPVHNLTKGQYYNTISSAVTNAANGDAIELADLIYNETISIPAAKSLVIKSTDPNNWDVVSKTIIQSNKSASFPAEGGPGGGPTSVFSLGSNSTLAGLTIRYSDIAVKCGKNAPFGSDPNPIITNCIITDNWYGIRCTEGNAQIRNNKIFGNDSNGIAIKPISPGSTASPSIINNFIYSNTNGIAWKRNGTTQGLIRNNTIVKNTTAGITVTGSTGPVPEVNSCILWSNSDDLQNCSATYSCIEHTEDANGLGNITPSSPLFAAADNNDFHLAFNSPCIDKGDPAITGVGEFTLDGKPRKLRTAVDIGADEFGAVLNANTQKWYAAIQPAINAAAGGNTIIVPQGIYNENIDFLGKAITVRGTDPNNWDDVNSTVISTNNCHPAVTFRNGEGQSSVISGFTIQSDSLTSSGVECFASSPTIKHCIIRNLWSGIFAWGGEPQILNNKIFKNKAYGIWSGDGTPVIKNNMIYSNGEAGIYHDSSYTAVITNNTLVRNRYGIYCNGSDASVYNCIAWDNWAADLVGCATTYSCIQDDSTGDGNISDDPNFVNYCKFSDTTTAGGTTTTVVVANVSFYDVNDVIEYNSDGIPRLVTEVNAVSGIITFANDPLGANSSANIRLSNWGYGATDLVPDFHLTASSHCINAGKEGISYDTEQDIDSQDRMYDGRVDIGVDEVMP